jgi:hypothetical protein
MEIMVRRKLTVGGLIGHLASVSHYHKSNTFDVLVVFPHAISLWNMIPGSLLLLFNVYWQASPPSLS